ncbi:pyridoxal phosphate-dependent aminotransferase [Terriglobus albidus]|uniref:pyridoxal phosphate-dependent aminotransferase n=1 Tax=Terriglobus albidus TaxID=1592106 RepID=UPI0021E0E902|nr:pyridoxal phosphate-dependent aminotransferase [Terriglobus albidus]
MPIASTTSALRLSKLAPSIVQSEIRAMTIACNAIDGINMSQGVCDTDPPHPVIEGAVNAMRNGFNIYARMDGIDSLRHAIARKFAHYNAITADPDGEILVTTGTTGAMLATCMALFDPGDEVIVFEPFYGYHVNMLLGLNLKPVIVPLTAPRWDFDPEALANAITPKTRAILVNTPGNPSGKVFTRTELEALAAIAIDADLFVITDEIYEYFLYDGHEHISPATLPGMAERTITIAGFSKTFSVTGWRLGYLHASKRWTPSIAYFHDLLFISAPAPLQHGVAAGLCDLPDSFYTEMRTEYVAKRDKTVAALSDAGLTPTIPQGAYYILADVSRVEGSTSKEKARNLLKQVGVAAVAGSAFFRAGKGENLLRFCYAKKDDALDEACRRLRSL